jgi:toxin ParE1/3/4
VIAIDKPKAADRFVGRIYAAEDLLANFPQIGEARADLAPELRKWTVGPYLMFYRVTPEGIDIVRILHGAQDLPTLMRSPPPEPADD